MKKALITILALGAIVVLKQAKADENSNYCADKEAQQEWSNMLDQYPNDPAVIHLAAYRYGLCRLVLEQRVAGEVAIELFELERVRVLERRKKEQIGQEIKL